MARSDIVETGPGSLRARPPTFTTFPRGGAVGLPRRVGDEMNFVMRRVEYDDQKERAYIEFRGPDGDGGDAIVTAIFSYRTSERLNKKQLHEEMVRKARHLLKRAAAAA